MLTEQFELGFGRDLDSVLRARDSELWITGIDPNARRFTDICGTIGPEIMGAIDAKGFWDSDAGFRADAHKQLPTIERKVDVFLLNHDHFNKPDELLQPLVVHELAHYLEQLGEVPVPEEKDRNNAGAVMASLEDNIRRIHTYEWAHHLTIATRRIIQGDHSKHKTIRGFLEVAVPEYDRKMPISARE